MGVTIGLVKGTYSSFDFFYCRKASMASQMLRNVQRWRLLAFRRKFYGFLIAS